MLKQQIKIHKNVLHPHSVCDVGTMLPQFFVNETVFDNIQSAEIQLCAYFIRKIFIQKALCNLPAGKCFPEKSVMYVCDFFHCFIRMIPIRY